MLIWPELTHGGAGGRNFIYGMIALQIACLGWAIGSSHSRRHGRQENVFSATAAQMLAGGAMMLLLGTARGEWSGLSFSTRSATASLEAEIPNVARLTAEGITFGYDPNHDATTGHQELLRIASASITFPSLGVTGSLRPYDPAAGRNVTPPTDGTALPSSVVPGLVVYDDGFALGTAELAYGLPPMPPGQTVQAGNELRATTAGTSPQDRDINLFGILEFDDLRIGVQNFSVTFGAPPTSFDGNIFIASGGVKFLPGKAITAPGHRPHDRRRPQPRRHARTPRRSARS